MNRVIVLHSSLLADKRSLKCFHMLYCSLHDVTLFSSLPVLWSIPQAQITFRTSSV